jgi:hypothetical protein
VLFFCTLKGLELAAFSALAGRAEDAGKLLARVQSQRTTKPALSFPDWVGDGALKHWAQLIQDRTVFEQSSLQLHQAITAKQLVDSGMLPL